MTLDIHSPESLNVCYTLQPTYTLNFIIIFIHDFSNVITFLKYCYAPLFYFILLYLLIVPPLLGLNSIWRDFAVLSTNYVILYIIWNYFSTKIHQIFPYLINIISIRRISFSHWYLYSYNSRKLANFPSRLISYYNYIFFLILIWEKRNYYTSDKDFLARDIC